MSTLFLLILLLDHHFICQSQPRIIKAVNLTTSNMMQDGAIITLPNINNDASIDNVNNEFDITVTRETTSEQGYHFEIYLNSAWGFHSNKVSYIKHTIFSNTDAAGGDLELLISFSVANMQYITVQITADNLKPNEIYPQCDTSSTVAYGDVKALVDADTSFGETNRDKKCSAAGHWKILQPNNYDTNHDNEWPIIITLENNPINDTLFVYIDSPSWASWRQQCQYTNAFPVDSGLQIYIALDDPDENIKFQQFSIEYLHEITTSAPTTSTPTTSAPTTANPTTSAPTTSVPTTSVPTTANPTTDYPTTTSPTTVFPTTIQPTTFRPTTIQPTTLTPTTIQPTTLRPTTDFPTTVIPTTDPTISPSTVMPTLYPTIDPTHPTIRDKKLCTVKNNLTVQVLGDDVSSKRETISQNLVNYFNGSCSVNVIIVGEKKDDIILIVLIDSDQELDVSQVQNDIVETINDSEVDIVVFDNNEIKTTEYGRNDTSKVGNSYMIYIVMIVIIVVLLIFSILLLLIACIKVKNKLKKQNENMNQTIENENNIEMKRVIPEAGNQHMNQTIKKKRVMSQSELMGGSYENGSINTNVFSEGNLDNTKRLPNYNRHSDSANISNDDHESSEDIYNKDTVPTTGGDTPFGDMNSKAGIV